MGRNQECVSACCLTLRYKLQLIELGNKWIGTYMYGIPQWSLGPIQGVRMLLVVESASLVLECVRLVSYCESLWCPMYEWCTGVRYLVICLCSVWC